MARRTVSVPLTVFLTACLWCLPASAQEEEDALDSGYTREMEERERQSDIPDIYEEEGLSEREALPPAEMAPPRGQLETQPLEEVDQDHREPMGDFYTSDHAEESVHIDPKDENE